MRLKSAGAALLICLFASSAFAKQPATTVVKPGKQIDSVWNGVLIGTGVGAVGAWIFTRANCGPSGYDPECSAAAGLVGIAIFIPGGAVAGGVIDRLINKTLPAGTKAQTSFTPTLSKAHGRINTGVAFRFRLKF